MERKMNKYKKYRQGKWQIVEVGRKIIRDYDGMNAAAGKAMNFRGYPMRKNTILIDGTMSPALKRATIKHEIAEYKLMKKGKGYWDAHRFALKHERD
jgi:hypothetical protein